MNTVDPAGAASAALYTQPVQVKTETPANNVTQRPVVEVNNSDASNNAASQNINQGNNNDSRIGSNIDTTA